MNIEKPQTMNGSNRQRKSTLTQQQKNKKRQRATPNQLTVLRAEFRINPTPNAKTREEIGRKIDMTERSVQIWFQNKRAKAKQYNRRSNEPNIPKMLPFMGPDGQFNSMYPYYPAGNFVNIPNSNFSMSNEVFLPCSTLSIGTWRRVSQSGDISSEIHFTYSFVDNSLNYTMYSQGTSFKIKYHMTQVKMITVVSPANQNTAELKIQLTASPRFYIQSSKKPGVWVPTEDFTEERQASNILAHSITGPAVQLQMQLSCVAPIAPGKISGLSLSHQSMVSPINYVSSPLQHYTKTSLMQTPDSTLTSPLGFSVENLPDLIPRQHYGNIENPTTPQEIAGSDDDLFLDLEVSNESSPYSATESTSFPEFGSSSASTTENSSMIMLTGDDVLGMIPKTDETSTTTPVSPSYTYEYDSNQLVNESLFQDINIRSSSTPTISDLSNTGLLDNSDMLLINSFGQDTMVDGLTFDAEVVDKSQMVNSDKINFNESVDEMTLFNEDPALAT